MVVYHDISHSHGYLMVYHLWHNQWITQFNLHVFLLIWTWSSLKAGCCCRTLYSCSHFPVHSAFASALTAMNCWAQRWIFPFMRRATGETFCLAGSIATWAGRTNEFRTRYFDIFCGSQMGESLLPITKTPPNKKNRIGVALLFFLLGTIGFLIVVIENQ